MIVRSLGIPHRIFQRISSLSERGLSAYISLSMIGHCSADEGLLGYVAFYLR